MIFHADCLQNFANKASHIWGRPHATAVDSGVADAGRYHGSHLDGYLVHNCGAAESSAQ